MIRPHALHGLSLLVFLACIGGCQTGTVDTEDSPAASIVETPASPEATVPRLWVDGSDLGLSWIESAGEERSLLISLLRGDGWSEPVTLTSDPALLVNWADFPAVTPLANGLAATWLVRTEGSGFAYGLRFSVSTDRGASWSEPLRPHPDQAGEFGFASVVTHPQGAASLIWLDGRDVERSGGAMRLMERRWDGDRLAPESVLDDDVCSCCQTSAVALPDGVLVAYRDHTPGEIRDISTVRLRDGRWSSPRSVHDDGWVIGGCPVNGPVAAADGERVALTWFTAADNRPRVLFALSDDGGDTFSVPVRIDDGDPIGRVDLRMQEQHAIVSWLERGEQGAASVRVRRIGADGALGSSVVLGRTSAKRAAGFPRIATIDDELFAVWSDAESGGIVLVRARLAQLPTAS